MARVAEITITAVPTVNNTPSCSRSTVSMEVWAISESRVISGMRAESTAANCESTADTKNTDLSPKAWITGVASSGPTTMPTRCIPPNIDIARARQPSSTASIRNDWRASKKTDHVAPDTATAAANSANDEVLQATTMARASIVPAIRRGRRSPYFATSWPAGNEKSSEPTPKPAAINEVSWAEASRPRACKTKTASIAPWAVEALAAGT